MPFCEECAKYWAPSSMRPDGSCPTCGRLLEEPRVASTVPTHRRLTAENLDIRSLAAGATDEDARAPWHFKLLVMALCLYLGWRVVDLFL
ncbi:MAG: hypothetical protein ACKOCE_00665 [Acidimicrobiia bacterium]